MNMQHLRRWTTGLVLTAGITLGLSPSAAEAQYAMPQAPDVTYECLASDQGVPTTYARFYENGVQQNVPVIRWKSQYFAQAGWTPTRRCREVTNRFQAYEEDKKLRFLTNSTLTSRTGTAYPVICVAESRDSRCDGLLITLQLNDNPQSVLRDLMATGAGQSGPVTRGQLFVDMNQYLLDATPEAVFPLTEE